MTSKIVSPLADLAELVVLKDNGPSHLAMLDGNETLCQSKVPKAAPRREWDGLSGPVCSACWFGARPGSGVLTGVQV